jgi:long-chain acyl-CoA synthetase
MMGYYNMPEKTAEEIDSEGWFHTGDIGEFIEGEFLKITDRKKEMFKTSGGKYIAPQVMENKFKESRFIEQIMVIGENQKMPAAFIVPAFDFIRQWIKYKNHAIGTTESEIAASQIVIDRIKEEVDELNQSFGKWEQIKRFELVDHVWTPESGELTPTLKPKRKVLLSMQAKEYEKIYGHKPFE